MKKVLFISSNFYRENLSSSAAFAYELCNHLSNYFKIFVLAPHGDKLKFESTINNIDLYRFPYFYPFKYQKLAYGNGGGIPYNLKNSFLAKIQVPFFLLFELFYTIRLAKSKQVDILNSFWFIPQGLVGAIVNKFYKIPHVATIHSSEITLLKKIPFGKRVSEFIIDNTDSIISVSSHRASELSEFVSFKYSKKLNQKLSIIPMGVDVNIFEQNVSKELLRLKYNIKSKFLILFVGRFVEVKGCEYLIESLIKLDDFLDNIQLLIVGTGPLENKLKEQVKSLSLENSVRFEGVVDHSKINEYYSLADVVVVPSIEDSSGFQEGFPVVVLEALIAGKPIIATKTNGIMEIIKDNYNGILVEPKSSEQITNALLKLIKDKSLIDFLSKNTLITGKEYNWDSVIKRYMEVINSFPAQR